MLTTNWQADVVIYEIFLFMPIYFFVILTIWYLRPRKAAFKTHYYTLVLSQGGADFLTVSIFITQMLPRYFNVGNSLIWWLDQYGASNFYVNSGPQMFILRFVGLFLITMQRYATICRRNGTLHHILQNTSGYVLVSAHWLISLALHFPAVLICRANFENAQTFFVITSEDHKKTSAAIVIGTFVFCGTSTLFMYFSIIRMLCSTKRTSTVSVWQSRQNRFQEGRLCIHVFFLTVMSMATFSYYVFQAIYSNETDGVGDVIISDSPESKNLQQEGLRALRLWYPLVSGNLSFINPLMLVLLNRDIQKCLKCCEKASIENSTSSIIPMNRTL